MAFERGGGFRIHVKSVFYGKGKNSWEERPITKVLETIAIYCRIHVWMCLNEFLVHLTNSLSITL
jgi:hypothetical protein